MTRAEKIVFLNLHGVKVPFPRPNNAWLDAELAKFENRIVNYSGGRIQVFFNKADETPVEVMIYQDIGDDPWSGNEGFTAKTFSDALKDIPNTRALDLRINSAGGSVWEGLAIKTRLQDWKGKKTASIDGMAASVASWLAMDKDIELRAPRHAQMFIHDAWGMCMGNAEDMRSQAKDLDTTSHQIAQMYADKSGKPVDECRDLMKANSLFTAEQGMEMGFIDRLTDDEPVQNFTEKQIGNMKAKLVALNSINKPTQQGEQNTKNKMNRKQMEALLNKLGLKFNKADTDEQLVALLETYNAAAKPAKKKNAKGEMIGDDDEACNEEDEMNSPEPSAETPDADAAEGAPGKEGAMYKAATANTLKLNKRMEAVLNIQRKSALQVQFDKHVTAGRIGANEVPAWMNLALKQEGEDETNPIISQLNLLPSVLPGTAPLNIVMIDEDGSFEQLDRNVQNLLKAQTYFNRNGSAPERLHDRMMIAENSKRVSALINRHKQYSKTEMVAFNSSGQLPQLVGPLREMWDKYSAGIGPRNANTMSAQLLRQVILSETMRAFRRQFASLSIFAHNFGSVPLEGTDYIEVPYYPLDTVASTEFVQANGYVIAPNAQTLSKQIYVGGIGNGVATPGSGRKYKALQFSAYEIRRQPWLDIQKLSIMAGEQLAIDVRADIIGTNINAANFGNAIYTGAPGGFDHTVVGNVIMQAANRAFWPKAGRNLVLTTGNYSNLAIDPGITPWLNIGSTDILREGIIGKLYGFEQVIEDPLMPVVNSIRGGDGTLIAGTDPYSGGFAAWPSAVLIATAPIMPPPGVLKKLVAYEQITDDQTNLAFTYQFWGDEQRSRDNEIIECSYGSGLGELAALLRLTTQGN